LPHAPAIRTVTATRYVTPLREGGSLPALIEADDDGLYVLKFRGAGQGPRALIAELIGGEIGRLLGLPVPEIVFVDLDPALGRNEPDQEIQALITASAGLNVALDYLPGALAFDPLATPRPDPLLASEIVWFDAFITNVDRTVRNPNMLCWHQRLYLIDHGAGLYFHHTWHDPVGQSQTPFSRISDHVLLPLASDLRNADARLRHRLTDDGLRSILASVPDTWLEEVPGFSHPGALLEAYAEYFERRLNASGTFVEEAVRAHEQLG
jgi:hypothetical protein